MKGFLYIAVFAACFSTASCFAGEDASRLFDQGVGYERSGNYQEAISAFKQALRVKPDYTMALFGLGSSYENLGMYNDAAEAFKKVLVIQPGYGEAYSSLGEVYVKSGKYSDAVEAYNQAVNIFREGKSYPDLAKACLNLGVAYGGLGMFKEAAESLKQAISIKPDYAAAHYVLGVAFLKLDDKASAIGEYEVLKKLNPNSADLLFKQINRR